MIGSLVVYSGLIGLIAGLVLSVARPRRSRRSTRATILAAGGAVFLAAGLLFPASERRRDRAESRLDEFAPVWQFRELHTRRIAAPPARVWEAMSRVRADEIFLFRTLTWIRRGGRPHPPGILDPGKDESLIDVATRTTFTRLAEDAPRELVIGTVIRAPAGAPGTLRPEEFARVRVPGTTLAAMNFLIRPDGAGGSIVSTETRVFAGSAAAKRRFAAYWRAIYPGSALIRRMWLRAIERRAMEGDLREQEW